MLTTLYNANKLETVKILISFKANLHYSSQLDRHQTCKPVMVSVVSSSPTFHFIFLRNLNANFDSINALENQTKM